MWFEIRRTTLIAVVVTILVLSGIGLGTVVRAVVELAQ